MFENTEIVFWRTAVADKLEVKTAARHEFVVNKGDVGAEMYPLC